MVKRRRVADDSNKNNDDDEYLHHLERIVDNTRGRNGYQLIASGIDSRIVTVFDQPIKLDPKRHYELALLNLETYYSFPNINETNNKLRFRAKAADVWTAVTIPIGCYEVNAIGAVIASQVGGDKIVLKANLNTLKCVLCIKDTYEVDFKVKNSLRTVLGFNAIVYKKGMHSSENSVNILQVNSILVHTDIVTNTYQNGKMEPIIYSFFPNVSPGEKIVSIQKNLVYSPVTTDTIYRMTTWLTDQDGIKLDLRGETLTVRYYLRER